VSRTRFITEAEADTFALGRALARRLALPATVLFFGELGAGKTVFIRGMCRELDVPPADVRSPSFTLVNEYRGRCRVAHVDLYRLGGPADLESIGYHDLEETADLLLVEWAERLEAAHPGALEVRMEHLGDDRRRVTIVNGPDGVCVEPV